MGRDFNNLLWASSMIANNMKYIDLGMNTMSGVSFGMAEHFDRINKLGWNNVTIGLTEQLRVQNMSGFREMLGTAFRLSEQFKGLDMPVLNTLGKMQASYPRHFSGMDMSGLQVANSFKLNFTEHLKRIDLSGFRAMMGVSSTFVDHFKLVDDSAIKSMMGASTSFAEHFKAIDMSKFQTVLGASTNVAKYMESIKGTLEIKGMMNASFRMANVIERVDSSGMRALVEVTANLAKYIESADGEELETILAADMSDSLERMPSELEKLYGFLERHIKLTQPTSSVSSDVVGDSTSTVVTEKLRISSIFILIIMLCSAVFIADAKLMKFKDGYSNWESKRFVKNIDQVISNFVNELESVGLRIVSKDGLQVRESNKRRSNCLVNLRVGSIVNVMEQRRNWTLIEYQTDDERYLKGWVFSRYLSRPVQGNRDD